MNGAIETTVNYVDRSRIGSEGLRFNFDQAWSGIPVDPRTVAIQDAATMGEAPTLQSHGFTTVRTGCDDLAQVRLEQIEQLWVPAVRAQLAALTGADEVACWGFSMRFSESKTDAPRSEVSDPARRVHADFSPAEFGHAIRHSLTLAEIARLSRGRELKRWIGLNAWQAWSQPPYDTPLAVCDKTSVSLDDLVIGTGSAPSKPDFTLDLSLFSYSPRHRWYYHSAFARDEALVFLGIDSAQRDAWQIVPHSAFDNPAAPPDAPPRCSVEMRCMALFFE